MSPSSSTDTDRIQERYEMAKWVMWILTIAAVVVFSVGMIWLSMDIRNAALQIKDCTVPGSACYAAEERRADRVIQRIESAINQSDLENDRQRQELRNLVERLARDLEERQEEQ